MNRIFFLCAFILSTWAPVAQAASLSPHVFPVAVVGTYYDQVVTAPSALVPPISWSHPDSDLPPGLTIGSDTGHTVHLKGTPTTAGTYTFKIRAKDANAVIYDQPYTFVVETAPRITTEALPTGTVGFNYSSWLGITGGTTPYSWTISGDSLPTGLIFDREAGRIYGTPTAAANSRITVTARDAYGVTASKTLTLNVGPNGGSDSDQRLENFRRIGVGVHNLVKLPDDRNPNTQADSAVYYLGTDGRRHAFPNAKVYLSWYSDFSGVRVLNNSDLASIQLGANVTYHPGVKMVKFTTDPRTYAVAGGRTLRWVVSETAARDLYGPLWNRAIDDISDAFYVDYTVTTSDPITSRSSFDPVTVRNAYTYPSELLP